jgi:hypothetical protein
MHRIAFKSIRILLTLCWNIYEKEKNFAFKKMNCFPYAFWWVLTVFLLLDAMHTLNAKFQVCKQAIQSCKLRNTVPLNVFWVDFRINAWVKLSLRFSHILNRLNYYTKYRVFFEYNFDKYMIIYIIH